VDQMDFTELAGDFHALALESDGELPTTLDQAPPGWFGRIWREFYGLHSRDGDARLTAKPANARAGDRVVVRHRLPAGETGYLKIGDGAKFAVGSGRTEFIARPGLTRIRLTRGGLATCCEVTLIGFAAPHLNYLRWLADPVVARPVPLEWSVTGAARTRLEVILGGRHLFDSASPDRAAADVPTAARGRRVVRFERTGDVLLRLTAEAPASPWRDHRKRVFTVTTPVAAAVPTVDQITVPTEVRVGDTIPIVFQSSGADRLRLLCTQADTVWEQTLPPNGSTVLFATSVGHLDLCFVAEPMPLADDVDATSHGTVWKTTHRRITIRPRIEVSAQELRGPPRSRQALTFAIRGASQAWLVHPMRRQSDKIEMSGAMSMRIGDAIEPVTIMACAETGEESSEIINLIPVEGFFRRLFNVRRWK
jgi:hypothetical protein